MRCTRNIINGVGTPKIHWLLYDTCIVLQIVNIISAYVECRIHDHGKSLNFTLFQCRNAEWKLEMAKQCAPDDNDVLNDCSVITAVGFIVLF